MFKWIGFLSLFLSLSLQAADLTPWVKELKNLFIEIEMLNPHELSLEDKRSIVRNFDLIQNAYASSYYDCIYAGWPSKKVKIGDKFVCRAPFLSRDYKNGPCSQDELQCQPLLYGPGICVNFKSKEDKLNGLKHCEKKFLNQGGDYKFVKNFDSHDKQALLDLSYLAGNLCSKIKTDSCFSLKDKLPKVLNQLEDRPVKPKSTQKETNIFESPNVCEEPRTGAGSPILKAANYNLDQIYEKLKKDFLASPHCKPELVLGNPEEKPDAILMQTALDEVSLIMEASKMGNGIDQLMEKYQLSAEEKTEIKARLVPFPKKYNDKLRNVDQSADMRFWENDLDFRKNRYMAEIKLLQGIIKSIKQKRSSSEIAEGLMNNGIFTIANDDKPECPFVTKDAFIKAMTGFDEIKKRGVPPLKNKNQLTIVDYTQPSNQRRMFVFDLEKMQVLHNTWTAHGGKGSGADGWGANPEFSNQLGSGKSSDGFILAKTASYGARFGDNVILQGIDDNNSNLQSRAVVLHAWNTPLGTYNPDVVNHLMEAKDGTWIELGNIKSNLRSSLTYQKYMSPTEGCLGVTQMNVKHLDRKKRSLEEMKALEKKGYSQVEYLRQDLPGTIIFSYSGEEQESKFY